MKTRFRALLGWLPFTLLALAVSLTWASFLSGGPWSITAFLFLVMPVPALALVLWIATVIRTMQTKRNVPRLFATHAVMLLSLWPAGWNVGFMTIRFPYELSKKSPTATIRVPTNVPMRVGWGGDDLDHNYHSALPDQRWAYDLMVDPAFTHGKSLEEYGCWGVPVVAPATGHVHIAHDGERDQTPGAISYEYKQPLGNHVVIALDSGAYLLVAHLQKGSVVAWEGEAISEGDAIGKCGNSGNTSEPHVHVHAQRQDPRGRPPGMSEGLPLFFHDHDGAPMPLGGFDRTGDQPKPNGAVIRHVGSDLKATSR